MSAALKYQYSDGQDILLQSFPPNRISDWLLGIKNGSLKLLSYIKTRSFKKLFYLCYSIVVEPRELAIRKLAIEKCRAKYPTLIIDRVRVRDLAPGHGSGWKFDKELQNRIARLKAVPPGKLTDELLHELCPSDSPPEVWSQILLNGNGRARSLMEAGHGDYYLEILRRV